MPRRTPSRFPAPVEPRATIYLRVSTEEQADSGLGLEAQHAACHAWAARALLPVAGVHADTASGTVPPSERSGLSAALADLSPGGVLLVARLDRVSRDPYYALAVERVAAAAGARVVSAAGESTEDDSPSGILMRRIIQAFGEYERLLICARTAAAMRAKRTRGEYTGGGVPYGLRVGDDGALVPEPAEHGALEHARDARSAGLSLRDVGRHLRECGFRPRGGGLDWHATAVRRLRAGQGQEVARGR